MLNKVMVRADFRCDGQIIPVSIININNSQYIKKVVRIRLNTIFEGKCYSQYICELDNNCEQMLYFDNFYWYIDK